MHTGLLVVHTADTLVPDSSMSVGLAVLPIICRMLFIKSGKSISFSFREIDGSISQTTHIKACFMDEFEDSRVI